MLSPPWQPEEMFVYGIIIKLFPFIQIINYLSFSSKWSTAILTIQFPLSSFVYQAGGRKEKQPSTLPLAFGPGTPNLSSHRPGSLPIWKKLKHDPGGSPALLADPGSAP